MRRPKTLEEYLAKLPTAQLVDVEDELLNDIIPSTGYARELYRTINKMIDAGTLCINPSQYRRVTIPALTRAVHREAARRYINALRQGFIRPSKPGEQISFGQLAKEA